MIIDKKDKILKVVCVLRTGGDYTAEYVQNLYNMVRVGLKTIINPTVPFVFICLTDEKRGVFDSAPDNFVTIPFRDNYHGWWSKIEVFRVKGPAIYIDLDTAILKAGALIRLTNELLLTDDISFYMLRAFNSNRKWASGIMAWTDTEEVNWRFLYEEFEARHMHVKMDQIYIENKLKEHEVDIKSIQDFITVYSYKHHCRENGPPKDTEVVCFHGKPYPHEVGAPYFTIKGRQQVIA